VVWDKIMVWSPEALINGLVARLPDKSARHEPVLLPRQSTEIAPDPEAVRKGYFLARMGLVDSYAPQNGLGGPDYLDQAEEMIFKANQLNKQAAVARATRPVQFKGTPAGPDVNINIKQLDGKRGRGAASVASPGATPKGNLGAFINAIAGKESGGSYSARNSDSGAMGKYQIMPANIAGPGGWDKEILGRNITPQQFMNNPQLQEQIARGKLTQYYNKYGAKGAASAWYSGDPNKWRNTGSQGAYPSIYNYVMSILKAMGR
jgi:hypothetical protein